MNIRPNKRLRCLESHAPNKCTKLDIPAQPHLEAASILFNPNHTSDNALTMLISPNENKIIDTVTEKAKLEACINREREQAIEIAERSRQYQLERDNHRKKVELEKSKARQILAFDQNTTEEFLDAKISRINILSDFQDTYHKTFKSIFHALKDPRIKP